MDIVDTATMTTTGSATTERNRNGRTQEGHNGDEDLPTEAAILSNSEAGWTYSIVPAPAFVGGFIAFSQVGSNISFSLIFIICHLLSWLK
jgi:hypothetical protein